MSAPATGAGARRGVLASRPAWVVLALVLAGLLAIGSVHGRPRSGADRIAYLESVIKCPSCEDLAISQSTSLPAVHLRQLVTAWVGEGRSDGWIEQQVVDHYGSAALLKPPVSGLDALVWVVPLVVLGCGALGLGWFLLSRRRAGVRRPGDVAVVPAPEDAALVDAALAAAFGSPGDGER